MRSLLSDLEPAGENEGDEEQAWALTRLRPEFLSYHQHHRRDHARRYLRKAVDDKGDAVVEVPRLGACQVPA